MRRLIRVFRDAYSGLPKVMWYLSTVTLINRSGTMVVPFLSLYVTQSLNLELIIAGWAMTLYGVGSLAGSFIGGWATDRFGALRTQWIALLSAGFCFELFTFAVETKQLLGAAFLLGCAAESVRPATATAIGYFTDESNRAQAYALDRFAINIGSAVGPLIGGFLAAVDYHLLFHVDAVTSFLAGCFVFFILSGRKSKVVMKKPDKTQPKGKSPLRDGIFVAFLFSALITLTAFFQVFGTLPIYFKEVYHIPEQGYGMVFALNAVMILSLEMVLVHRFKNRPELLMVAIGTLFLVPSFAMLPFGNGYAWVVIHVVLWTIAEMLMSPFASTFTANRAGDHNRGAYMGYMIAIFAMAHIFAPLVGTRIWETFGHRALWLSVAGMALTGSITAFLVHRVLQARSRPPVPEVIT